MSLAPGESREVVGSSGNTYTVRNSGGIYSCTCPAWRHQSRGIENRTCKHLRSILGDAADAARLSAPPSSPIQGAPPATPATVETTAIPRFLLAHSWDNAQDLRGWWASEKLDGVRAWWDGRCFISRQGNTFYAPEWFKEGLPSTPLDGELWVGRKEFQRTVSIVRRQDFSEDWRELKYMVFDAPSHGGPFEARMEWLEQMIQERMPPFAEVHSHVTVTDMDALRWGLEDLEKKGGEGLMVRQPGSLYTAGRSWSLLKIKQFHDAEARVVEHLPGAGKHAGRLGALLVELANGTRFSVGTGLSDAERESPPAVGSLITFRYQELSNGGVPRFPSFVRQRSDDTEFRSPEVSLRPAESRPAPRVPRPAPAPVSLNPSAYLEYDGGATTKFWEVRVEGALQTIRYGRVGDKGKESSLRYPTPVEAARETYALIQQKKDKGYVERSRNSG